MDLLACRKNGAHTVVSCLLHHACLHPARLKASSSTLLCAAASGCRTLVVSCLKEGKC